MPLPFHVIGDCSRARWDHRRAIRCETEQADSISPGALHLSFPHRETSLCTPIPSSAATLV